MVAPIKYFLTSHSQWNSRAAESHNGNALWFSTLGGSKNSPRPELQMASVVDLKIVAVYLLCLALPILQVALYASFSGILILQFLKYYECFYLFIS